MLRRLILLSVFAAVTLGLAEVVWRLSASEALARLADRGRADLRLSADRLVGALQRFRGVAVLMADHPEVLALALDRGGDPAQVGALLRRVADGAGALDMILVDLQGRVHAGGSGRARQLPASPDLQRAGHGALGRFHFVEPQSGRRIFSIAAPVFSPEGPVVAAVVLRLDADAVEAPGRGDPVPVWFADESGVTFIANRSEMVFQRDARDTPVDPAIYPADIALTRRVSDLTARAGVTLARNPDAPYLPELALPLSRALPVIGMTGHALIDAAPALRFARAQALVTAVALLGFGAVLLALGERRRALAVRLAAEARANAALEARVAARTAELLETNDRLTRAQADLVQAGKLSALGQMSAGISHELNQPLMAIRSYAENAALYLDRGRSSEAAQNLVRISDLARRMGRIIKNLRAFARQESEPMRDVDMVAVIGSALDLVQGKLDRAGVTLLWRAPDAPVMVRGGEVRLGQVVVNLLSNAADAMADSPQRQIDMALTRHGGRVRLTIADTGPGISEPDRIFDPFYSTKAVGSAEGMGLGLSISYGLVQSFGGAIAGRNRPDRGAIFTVELDAVGGGQA